MHAALKEIAYKIQRAAENDRTTEQHYDRMVAAIREGAKAHQRFRPDHCPREITLAQETNYFIVRCTVDALNHPDRTVAQLSTLRDDYVHASLMVEHDRARFCDALTVEESAIVEQYDYPRMNPVKR